MMVLDSGLLFWPTLYIVYLFLGTSHSQHGFHVGLFIVLNIGLYGPAV